MNKTILLIISLFSLSVLQCLKANEDVAPCNAREHFEWCNNANNRDTILLRLEGFWQKYHRNDETYPDEQQSRLVRLCAYRIVWWYNGDGFTSSRRAQELLKWLEKTDKSFSSK